MTLCSVQTYQLKGSFKDTSLKSRNLTSQSTSHVVSIMNCAAPRISPVLMVWVCRRVTVCNPRISSNETGELFTNAYRFTPAHSSIGSLLSHLDSPYHLYPHHPNPVSSSHHLVENLIGFDFAMGPEEATTAAKGDVSGTADTKETVVWVVENERDGRGERET